MCGKAVLCIYIYMIFSSFSQQLDEVIILSLEKMLLGLPEL